MNRILRHRPSPAMVVAFIALSVALAGTATALPGRNAVKKGDIARSAVTSRTIARNAVRSRHIKSRNVTRSKIAKKAIDSSLVGTDALTGGNILESSLGAVPNATNAANAATVNGLSVKKFSFRGPAVTGSGPALSLLGLTLNAGCNSGPNLSVSATTTSSGAIIHSGGTWNGGVAADFYVDDNDFNVGETFDPLDDATTGSTSLEGSVVYVRQDGGVVTASFLAQESGGTCTFAGTATGDPLPSPAGG
jgi:hypothetical protein